MAQDINRKLEQPAWQEVVTGAAAPTAAPSAATDGEGVEPEERGEFLHLAVEKTSTATVVVWGYSASIGEWFAIETVSFTGSTNEGAALQAATQYDRLAVQVTALGGGTLTAHLGMGV